MNLKNKFRTLKKADTRVHYKDPVSKEQLSKYIQKALYNHKEENIAVICIGTDRSTGDALGPLIGTKLKQQNSPLYHIYGTLDNPVHAVNLQDTLDDINKHLDHPFIIGVDACLGRYNNVGTVTVADGPVRPGAGVKKELPPVGNIHITGIVNVSGYMEYFVLQNTRLSLVMQMSQLIAEGLHDALVERFNKEAQPTINVRF